MVRFYYATIDYNHGYYANGSMKNQRDSFISIPVRVCDVKTRLII